MTPLYTAENLQHANLILDMLQHHNIDAVIINQFSQGGVGELPFNFPEIWLKQKHQTTLAKQLISKFERQTDSDIIIYCGKCGESNPDNFETCWSCGAILVTSSE